MYIKDIICFGFLWITFGDLVAFGYVNNEFVKFIQQTMPKHFSYIGHAYNIPPEIIFEDFYQNLIRSHPETINITSPQYPNPYPIAGNTQYKLTVANSTGMEIIVHKLDIDPLTDFLKLTPLNSDGSERRSIVLTGSLNSTMKFRSVGYTNVNVTFGAWTNEGHAFKGFLITYTPYKSINSSAAMDSVLVASELEDMETLNKYLYIPNRQQTNNTWQRLKALLAQSINEYIKLNQTLDCELVTPSNVIFVYLGRCSKFWPNSEHCIDLEFSIVIFNDSSETSFIEKNTFRAPTSLSREHLELMWEKFGLRNFQQMGFTVFLVPDVRLETLIDAGIFLGISVATLLLFVAICRTQIVRDILIENKNMKPEKNQEKDNIDRENDDITMFPSQNQVISDLNSIRKSETIPASSSEITSYSTQYQLQADVIDSDNGKPNRYEGEF